MQSPTPPATPTAAVNLKVGISPQRRVVTFTATRILDVAPVTLTLPFGVIKQLAAQILAAEAQGEDQSGRMPAVQLER